MKRVLIIAGETSGDLHGSLLMQAMRDCCPDLMFKGIGGTRMIDAGCEVIRHVREMNFMGFVEVVRHLPFIRRTFADLRALYRSWRPDLAILIDYPGFNLRLAKELKQAGIPVMYYISPQLWAWHKDRVKLVRRYVDRMVVLFRFEQEFYRDHDIEADFVGHPLLDIARPSVDRDTFRAELGIADESPLIGLLPGSRRQEIDRMLPTMIGAVRLLDRPGRPVAAALGVAGELDAEWVEEALGATGIMPVRDRTYDLMAHADALIVTSGTATLESGIIGTPMVIVYKTSALTYRIGRALVKIDHIGMINIVAGSRIVPELWQDEVTPGNIATETERFLSEPGHASAARNALSIARDKLGEPGAAERAADIACGML